MTTLAFIQEIRDNAAIQAELVALYAEGLPNKRARNDVIKGAPTKLLAAIAFAMDSQRLY